MAQSARVHTLLLRGQSMILDTDCSLSTAKCVLKAKKKKAILF